MATESLAHTMVRLFSTRLTATLGTAATHITLPVEGDSLRVHFAALDVQPSMKCLPRLNEVLEEVNTLLMPRYDHLDDVRSSPLFLAWSKESVPSVRLSNRWFVYIRQQARPLHQLLGLDATPAVTATPFSFYHRSMGTESLYTQTVTGRRKVVPVGALRRQEERRETRERRQQRAATAHAAKPEGSSPDTADPPVPFMDEDALVSVWNTGAPDRLDTPSDSLPHSEQQSPGPSEEAITPVSTPEMITIAEDVINFVATNLTVAGVTDRVRFATSFVETHLYHRLWANQAGEPNALCFFRSPGHPDVTVVIFHSQLVSRHNPDNDVFLMAMHSPGTSVWHVVRTLLLSDFAHHVQGTSPPPRPMSLPVIAFDAACGFEEGSIMEYVGAWTELPDSWRKLGMSAIRARNRMPAQKKKGGMRPHCVCSARGPCPGRRLCLHPPPNHPKRQRLAVRRLTW